MGLSRSGSNVTTVKPGISNRRKYLGLDVIFDSNKYVCRLQDFEIMNVTLNTIKVFYLFLSNFNFLQLHLHKFIIGKKNYFGKSIRSVTGRVNIILIYLFHWTSNHSFFSSSKFSDELFRLATKHLRCNYVREFFKLRPRLGRKKGDSLFRFRSNIIFRVRDFRLKIFSMLFLGLSSALRRFNDVLRTTAKDLYGEAFARLSPLYSVKLQNWFTYILYYNLYHSQHMYINNDIRHLVQQIYRKVQLCSYKCNTSHPKYLNATQNLTNENFELYQERGN